ncbi:hypothetical protein TYRP_023133, partial [Tyrophagus putrescentiae]
MIKKLFLNPADPQAEYMYQDPTRHRLSPLEKQNHNGKIRAMFVEKPGNFELHDCRQNMKKFNESSTKKRYSNFGIYNYCETCRSKFPTHGLFCNHLRQPHGNKLTQAVETAYDYLYAPRESHTIKRGNIKGLKTQSESLSSTENGSYFIGRCEQFKRYQNEPPLPVEYDIVANNSTHMVSGNVIRTSEKAKEELLKVTPPYFSHPDYSHNSALNTTTPVMNKYLEREVQAGGVPQHPLTDDEEVAPNTTKSQQVQGAAVSNIHFNKNDEESPQAPYRGMTTINLVKSQQISQLVKSTAVTSTNSESSGSSQSFAFPLTTSSESSSSSQTSSSQTSKKAKRAKKAKKVKYAPM